MKTRLESDTNFGQEEEAKQIQKLLNRNEKSVAKSEDVKQTIVNMFLERYSKKHIYNDENQHKIGMSLINNFGDLKMTAESAGITLPTLKLMIENSPTLKMYWREAHAMIKILHDSTLMKLAYGENPNMKALQMIDKHLYGKREDGKFDGSDFGTLGLDDEVAVQNQEALKVDKERGGTNISLNFQIRNNNGDNVTVQTMDIKNIVESHYNKQDVIEVENLSTEE